MKEFNTTGLCVPTKHYMVDISKRLELMKTMVEEGKYFTVNRGRQYGKTTTLKMLARYLKDDYVVLSLDFQGISSEGFKSESTFVQELSKMFVEAAELRGMPIPQEYLDMFSQFAYNKNGDMRLSDIFTTFLKWCNRSDKPIVLIIDEVDSASNNGVFLDLLALLRYHYLERAASDDYKTFQSVILAGVTDIKNLKRKLRPDEVGKVNSPWNIAVDFTLDMSLSAEGIAGMLKDYENDHNTGMDVEAVAKEIRAYTGGYPFLVCRICQLLDKELAGSERFPALSDAWTQDGISEAVRIIVSESNTLFDSLMGKIINNPEMSDALEDMLFSGKNIAYNRYNLAINDALMYGFIDVSGNTITIANRIFEMLLYNYYLSENEMKKHSMYRAASNERELFIKDGHLDMDKVLERFVVSFDDLYGDDYETFDEDEGRRRFLLYIRPIINGTGNYYVEAQTRNNRRMDVVIDYLGERFVVELKIWRGNAYNERGQEQLSDYLDYYHIQKGYMLSYNFNKNKEVGVKTISVGDKTLIEAVV